MVRKFITAKYGILFPSLSGSHLSFSHPPGYREAGRPRTGREKPQPATNRQGQSRTSSGYQLREVATTDEPPRQKQSPKRLFPSSSDSPTTENLAVARCCDQQQTARADINPRTAAGREKSQPPTNCFFRLRKFLFTSAQRFSIGLRSGLWAGHERTHNPFFLRNALATLDLCGAALSS
jgi:hypothetical protein